MAMARSCSTRSPRIVASVSPRCSNAPTATATRRSQLEEFTKGYLLARSVLTGNQVPPQGAGGAPGEGLLRLFDADGDGKLSKAEAAAAGEVLKKFDRNEDGELSREELTAGIAAKLTARPSADTPPGARFGAEQLLARWKEADKNGDGKWTKDEVPERAAEHFARIDANGDGVIDEAELKKMAEGFRADGGERGRVHDSHVRTGRRQQGWQVVEGRSSRADEREFRPH